MITRVLAKLRAIGNREIIDAELREELESHLEMEVEAQVARGLAPQRARVIARRVLGNQTLIRETSRDTWVFSSLDKLVQDLRYAVRGIISHPGFTAIAVLTLTLGTGATTALFSVFNAVLLKPMPFPGADRLVVLGYTYHGTPVPWASPAKFNQWRQSAEIFEDLSAVRSGSVDLRDGFGTHHVTAAWVSGTFFPMMGARAREGRLLSAGDDRPAADRVAVVSRGFQQSRLGNQDTVGQRVAIDGEPYEVVGILDSTFDSSSLALSADVWLPLRLDPNGTDQPPSLRAFARLASGVDLGAANASARLAGAAFQRAFPDFTTPQDTFLVLRLYDVLVGDVRPSLFVFMGAVIAVLLIACANMASLTLARGAARHRELAVRGGLGASRSRIVRQLLTESLLLAVIGGALGLVSGILAIRALLAINPSDLPRLSMHGSPVAMDWRVLTFTCLVVGVTTVACGLWPAIRLTRDDLAPSLAGRIASSGQRHHTPQQWLIAAELALAFVLVVGASLCIRAFVALRTADRGFESRQVLTARMSLADPRVRTTTGVARLVEAVVDQVSGLPGVSGVAAAASLPLQSDWLTSFQVSGRTAGGQPNLAGERVVTARYFDVLGIRRIAGRSFDQGDRKGAAPVAIVNAAMVRQVWPDRSPIGDQVVLFPGFVPGDDPPRRIVGIVEDVRDGLPLTVAPRPTVYVPLEQAPDRFLRTEPLAWLVRAHADSSLIVRPVEQAMDRASGGLALSSVKTLEAIKAETAIPSRFITVLMTTFGSAALLLAAVGVYGLMSYTVQRRSREIAIRLALGAQPGRVRNLMLLQAVTVVAVGTMIGLAGSWALARLLSAFLFTVSPHDTLAYAITPLILATSALIAVWIPVRRATQVDPAAAFRNE